MITDVREEKIDDDRDPDYVVSLNEDLSDSDEETSLPIEKIKRTDCKVLFIFYLGNTSESGTFTMQYFSYRIR